MKIHTMQVQCGVCGGTGFGTIRTAAAEWDADAIVYHRDPAICRDVLRRKRREVEELLDKAKANL